MVRLLLLHGNASWRESWRRVLPLLPVDAEAPDLPGFGAVRPGGQSFTEWVTERVRRGPCVVAAAGTTGFLALRVARDHGAFVRHVVLVGPAGLAAGHGRIAGIGRTVGGAALLRAAGTSVGRARFLGDQLGDPGRASKDVARTLLDGLRRSRAFADLARESTTALLDGADRIACPVDVLWGDRSGVLPISAAPELMGRLPSHARLHPIAGAGHALALERPEEVARTLSDAIRPHAPRGDRPDPA